MSPRPIAVVLLAGALLALGVVAWTLVVGGIRGGDSAILGRLDQGRVASGAKLYAVHCSACHGPLGEGQANWKTANPDGTMPAPPHDPSGHTWHHADGLLYRIVRDGGAMFESGSFKSAMPAFRSELSPSEIDAVITYLKSLWGNKEREFQSEVSERDPMPAIERGQ